MIGDSGITVFRCSGDELDDYKMSFGYRAVEYNLLPHKDHYRGYVTSAAGRSITRGRLSKVLGAPVRRVWVGATDKGVTIVAKCHVDNAYQAWGRLKSYVNSVSTSNTVEYTTIAGLTLFSITVTPDKEKEVIFA